MLNETNAVSALPVTPLHSPMVSQNVRLIQLQKESFGRSMPPSGFVPHTLGQRGGAGRQDGRREKSQKCHHSMNWLRESTLVTPHPRRYVITGFHIINGVL